MCKRLIYPGVLILMFVAILAGTARADTSGLIGWWKLDDGAGDIAVDSSRSAKDGTIHRTATGGLGTGGSAWAVDPDHGTVVSFNGTDSSGSYITTGITIPAMTFTNNFTWAFWAKQHTNQATNNDTILGNRYGGTASPLQFIKFTPTRFELYNDDGAYANGINYAPVPSNEWTHHVIVKAGKSLTYYRNGQESGTNTISKTIDPNPFFMGGDGQNVAELWQGWMSDVRLYESALTAAEVLGIMAGAGGAWPYASAPSPADGALHMDTWVNLSWRPGAFAVSHNVYLGDDLENVNSATVDSPEFRGNQTGTFIVAGFPGFPYPDGLVPGTTYYWRIDEVNDAEPNSPWKGEVWSFSIPPKTAYNPNPADGAEFIAVDKEFTWTPGFRAKLHTVYLGTDYNTVSNAAGGAPQGTAKYKPAAPLEPEKVYYWRVDEFDALATYKGNVWGFTTPGAAGAPQPANGAAGVQMNAILSWTPATSAVSHDVYLGTDKDAVRNATTASPEYKGNKAAGSESLDPGKLDWHSDYYWRVDAVYNTGTVKGLVWSFATADFITVDDFESYNDIDPPDASSNRIFESWIDGFGTTNNGALVGNEMPPYAEQTIIHGGAQSMPYFYDNANKTSEATLTLTYPRDWTQEGVTKLSLWFIGSTANSAERMYVALNGSAVVYNDDAAATRKTGWTEWIIDLQAFADQGVNLANVNTITIGFGTKGSPAAGGTGTMYFDDIRLYRPPTAP